jgi:hypothetical protein
MSVPPTLPRLTSALAALALAGVASASYPSSPHADAPSSNGVRLAASAQPLLTQDGSPSDDDQDVSTADGSSKTRQTGLAPGSGQSSRSERQPREPESKSYLPDWLNWMDSHPAPASGDGGGSSAPAAASGGKSEKKSEKEAQPSPEEEQQIGKPKASDSQGGKSTGGGKSPGGGDTGAGGDQGWIGKLISNIVHTIAKALGGS